jgi:hypothetical protein
MVNRFIQVYTNRIPFVKMESLSGENPASGHDIMVAGELGWYGTVPYRPLLHIFF